MAGISTPYRRTNRPFLDGLYSEGGRAAYIRHPKFSQHPEQFIRAFGIIQKDLLELFDYIEPSDVNLRTYSYRVHELFMRVCIEIEANFKAILNENGYGRRDLTMRDYKKTNTTHRLSSYQVKLPIWNGSRGSRRPYAAWRKGGSLPWYSAYNASKHSRHDNFQQANLNNLIDAVCGLVAVIGAQFQTEDFEPASRLIAWEGGTPPDGFEEAIGGYFRIKFPDDWPMRLRYDFDVPTIWRAADPFQSLTF